jgi:hypothetical protein
VQPNITAPRSCGWRFLAETDRFVGLVPLTTWLHDDLLLTIGTDASKMRKQKETGE